MKKHLLIFIFSIFCLIACDDNDLPEDYIVLDSKIIAIKIEDPEVLPGDTVYMKLLIAKNNMDQNSEIPVTWIIGEDADYQVESKYSEGLKFAIPVDILEEEDSVDVPVIAMVTIDKKILFAEKIFRITNNPVGKNPVISGIKVDWKTDAGIQTKNITNGETITFGPDIENFACTSITEELPGSGNEKLVYKWYISKSSNNDKQIEVNDKKDEIEALLGEDTKAAEFKQSVVYSLTEEQGTYSVYLVVRDNKINSSDSSLDRLGTDFYYFTVNVPL